MKAVVPAAGRGTRLRPLTDDRPKPLVTVDDRPLLSHGLDRLLELGATEFVLVVGYRKAALVDHYGDAYGGVPITYVHQREQRGLADAVVTAEGAVGSASPFLVCNGDNVIAGPLAGVVERQRETDASATLLVEDVSRAAAARTGVVVTDGDGHPVRVVEKADDPPSTLALTGLFAFDPVVFHACHLVEPSDRGEYELSDAIDLLLRAGHRVETVRLDGWRVNVNTPADRDRAATLLRGDGEPD